MPDWADSTMEPRRPYLAYLLRLWQVDTELGAVWRASLESAHSDERQAFGDLEQLFDYLAARTGQRGRIDEERKDDDEELQGS